MIRKILTAVLAAALCCATSWAVVPDSSAQRLISSLDGKEPLRSGVWGVLAVRMDGDTVACCNSVRKMVPASNMKLITTGLALKTLGPDYRFETGIGYSGELRDSTLYGDLYIIGGGDPTTGSASECAEPISSTFARWKRLVDKAGIKSIQGRIIGDPRFFSGDPVCRGWQYEDFGTYYGAGPLGLNFFENRQNFRVTPGVTVGARPYVSASYPDTPWMNYIISATTSPAKTANDLYYIDSDFGPYGEIRGTFPIDRRGATLECSNMFGAYTCAYYFYNYLAKNGIRAEKGYADVSPLGFVRTNLTLCDAGVMAVPQDKLTVIGTAKSPALVDIVHDTNHDSDNFYAETLLHMIGKTVSSSSQYDTCYVAESSLLNAMGLRTASGFNAQDGSGLSRHDYISPAFLVSFLRAMARTSVFDSYLSTLPVPGTKSTLQYRLKDAPEATKERVHMKSGSMDGVLCFSGYIEATDGNPNHMIVFSIITNNVTASSHSVGLLLEKVILALAAEN